MGVRTQTLRLPDFANMTLVVTWNPLAADLALLFAVIGLG